MRRPARIAAVVLFALAGVWLALGATPRPALVNRAGFSQAVFDRDGGLLRLTLTSDEKYRLWVPLRAISPSLVEATLMQEDRHFHAHPGVNPLSLLRAFSRTYLAGGRRIGGSTLSMQLARLRFGIRSRSVRGKLEQIARAIQLERHYSKDELLEAYLNLAPYGSNVEGVGAASLIWFQKNAAELSLAEALTLAVIPKSPHARSPLRESGRAVIASAREKLSAALAEATSREHAPHLDVALHAPADLPFRAPHFALRVAAEQPFAPAIASSLDADLQALAERQVRQFTERNRGIGLRNAIVLVVHAPTREVRAYVGSADHGDEAIDGQVDGIRARRSPGSALKPFLYGLALDAGLIHPETMLKDASFAVSAYNPENSDRDFLGPLSATEALVRSRNLPAVQLANELGTGALHGLLARAGIGGLRDAGYYGLALTLGGVELRMDELVALYVALANGGVLRPLHTTVSQPVAAGASEREVRLLSPEASFLVLEMLRANPRPDLDLARGAASAGEAIPWKTGTSFGLRDAWAVGLVGPYAIGVWVGNFDGSPNAAFVGREAAGPLFFAIADGLRASVRGALVLRSPPAGLRRVEVCALSGALPGPSCHHRKQTWFIPGRSPIARCEIHREVWVDAKTGLRACSESGARREVFEFWPSDLQKLFRTAGIARRSPPPYGPECGRASAPGLPPRISSPQPKLRYELSGDGRGEVPFSAVSDADSARLWWFVDDALVGVSASGEPLFWNARPGRFVVRAVDDQGRVGEQVLHVATRVTGRAEEGAR